LPTIKGKRVEGVTITTVKGTRKRKNFESFIKFIGL